MSNIDLLLSGLEKITLAAFHNLYGSDEAIHNTQRKRFSALLKKYLTVFGNAEVELISALGRTEIGGNHTDQNNGRVLAGAVNQDLPGRF